VGNTEIKAKTVSVSRSLNRQSIVLIMTVRFAALYSKKCLDYDSDQPIMDVMPRKRACRRSEVPGRQMSGPTPLGDFFENHQMGFFRYPIADPILSRGRQLNEVLRYSRVIALQFRDPDPRLGDCSGGHFSD
jgi:hypothetical protein